MRGGEGEAAMKKGPWTAAEDAILVEYVREHGEGNWNTVQKNSGLSRCGKSCRLRWANHLRPNLKKGSFSPEEELLILRLHAQLGNKWARMAAQMPGRTDNEIKNYWNTRMKRRQRAGLSLYSMERQKSHASEHHRPPMPLLAPAPIMFQSPLHSYNSGGPPLPLMPISLEPELPSNQFFPQLDPMLHHGPLTFGGGLGMKMETKPAHPTMMNEDVSILFDMLPQTPRVPYWYNSPGGEVSNSGPSSSVVTEDDIGLEMQQLASSLSIHAAANWTNNGLSGIS